MFKTNCLYAELDKLASVEMTQASLMCAPETWQWCLWTDCTWLEPHYACHRITEWKIVHFLTHKYAFIGGLIEKWDLCAITWKEMHKERWETVFKTVCKFLRVEKAFWFWFLYTYECWGRECKSHLQWNCPPVKRRCRLSVRYINKRSLHNRIILCYSFAHR